MDFDPGVYRVCDFPLRIVGRSLSPLVASSGRNTRAVLGFRLALLHSEIQSLQRAEPVLFPRREIASAIWYEKYRVVSNELLDEGKPVDPHHWFRALAVDVVTDLAFDHDYKQLDSPTFGIDYYKMTAKLITMSWVFQAFPFL